MVPYRIVTMGITLIYMTSLPSLVSDISTTSAIDVAKKLRETSPEGLHGKARP